MASSSALTHPPPAVGPSGCYSNMSPPQIGPKRKGKPDDGRALSRRERGRGEGTGQMKFVRLRKGQPGGRIAMSAASALRREISA